MMKLPATKTESSQTGEYSESDVHVCSTLAVAGSPTDSSSDDGLTAW